jgi:predicted RNA-binding Zn-ribbon protein involved in translation (DUF1610 family)
MAAALKAGLQQKRTIVCIYCRRRIDVGAKAMSLPCPHCQRALLLEDIVITGYAAKRVIETCGVINIDTRGDVTVNSLLCSTLVVNGKIKGNVICLGDATLSPTAIIRGDITAQRLCIAPGARIIGRVVIGDPGA